jgi:hypothetical protein
MITEQGRGKHAFAKIKKQRKFISQKVEIEKNTLNMPYT